MREKELNGNIFGMIYFLLFLFILENRKLDVI